MTAGNSRTLRPLVTGSSVLALTYKDGLMLCCDTKASYGNMCRYQDVPRMTKLGAATVICASGEYSDFQFLTSYLEKIHTKDWLNSDHDEYSMGPKEYAAVLSRVMYNKRCKFNPLWNSVLVAGINDGQKYLGYVDMYGTLYEEQLVATGLGRYFGLTLLREKHRPDMSEQEARDLLEECMKILFYRDTGASNRVQFALATSDGVKIEAPRTLDSKWNYEGWTRPTSAMGLAGCSW